MAGSNTVIVTPDMPSGGIAVACQKAVQHLVLLQDNACLASAAIAHGTTASKIKTVTTSTPYLVDGAQLALAASDDFWTLTGTTLTAGQVNKWLLCVDASGTASVVEGVHSTTAAGVSFADIVAADGNTYPSPGPSLSVLGQLTVTCNSSTFVPGTTLLTAATITVVYRDGYEATMTGAAIPFDRQ